MVSLDKRIILDLMQWLAANTPVASVRDRMPHIVTDDQYPFITVNRLNAADTTNVIRHLDITINIVTDSESEDEILELGDLLTDTLDDWYQQCEWNIMGNPLLNNVTDDSGKDGRIKATYDYQMDYIV